MAQFPARWSTSSGIRGEKTGGQAIHVEPEPLTLEGALDEPKLAGVSTGGDAAWIPAVTVRGGASGFYTIRVEK